MNFSFLLAGGTNDQQGSPITMILLMVGMFAIMYFVMIRPQKKRQKEEQEMRSAVDVGDEITTIGGICGRVVTVKEEHLIIETGADRNRMQITRWAIQQNNTANERLAAERAAAKEAAEKAKQEKLEAKGKKPREKKKKKDED
jgi:preprotein translocase subunit YajC